MVLVQPTYYGTDNSLTLEVLRRVGSNCRAVVRIEDDTADLKDTFVIDHMGYMLEADGLTAADADRLLDVLRQGNC